MKKPITLVAGAAAMLVGLIPLAAYSAPEMGVNQTTVVIKDSAITSSIKAQLAADNFKGLSHIGVDTVRSRAS